MKILRKTLVLSILTLGIGALSACEKRSLKSENSGGGGDRDKATITYEDYTTNVSLVPKENDLSEPTVLRKPTIIGELPTGSIFSISKQDSDKLNGVGLEFVPADGSIVGRVSSPSSELPKTTITVSVTNPNNPALNLQTTLNLTATWNVQCPNDVSNFDTNAWSFVNKAEFNKFSQAVFVHIGNIGGLMCLYGKTTITNRKSISKTVSQVAIVNTKWKLINDSSLECTSENPSDCVIK